MPITYLSPAVDFTETDNTLTTPQVGTSVGASVIQAVWGPVNEPVFINSENSLVNVFGEPTDENAKDWLATANYLSYVSSMWVVRAKSKGMANAIAKHSETPLLIQNNTDYTTNYESGNGTYGEFACKYAGALGNSIMVTYADSKTFKSWKWTDDQEEVHDWTLEFPYAPATSKYAEERGGLNDEIHLLVVDAGGMISGVKGTILEKFPFLSKAKDGRSLDGNNAFYKRVINEQSKYIYWMDFPTTEDNLNEDGSAFGVKAQQTKFASLKAPFEARLVDGADDFEATDGDIIIAFDEFKNKETFDVTNIICGSYSATVAKHVVENICEKRRDCVAFVSPNKNGNPIIGTVSEEDIEGGITTASAKILSETLKFREDPSFNVNSSYAVLDSAWKYQYDKYNDEYRWVPLCGDTAGVRARTSSMYAPWFSEGGYTRGQYKNVVKLSFNPNKEQRDILYPRGINPVVTFAGEGTILYGDKTLLTKPSAFQHTNVRFLFIYLEKTLTEASKYLLFEINDNITRSYARNLCEPFLDGVKGGRGVYDYAVICDDSNNTPEVIDSGMFKITVRVKPARSINYVLLDFVAERTGASAFTERG